MNRQSSLFLVLGLLGLWGCQGASKGPVSVQSTPTVEVVAPVRGNVERILTLTGDLRPYQEAKLYAKVAGHLQSLTVDVGDAVVEGQLLARLEIPEMQSKLRESAAEVSVSEAGMLTTRAEVQRSRQRLGEASQETGAARMEFEEARAQLQKARASEAFARQKKQRLEACYAADSGSVAVLELEQARADYRQSVAQIRAAEAERRASRRRWLASQERVQAAGEQVNVDLAKVQREQAEAEVSLRSWETQQSLARYAEIRAPFRGIVTARNLDPGDLVQTAVQGAQARLLPILVIADVRRLRLSLRVPEAEAARVVPGLPVWVEVQHQAAREAKVSRVSRALDPETRTMHAEVDLPNSDLAFTAGGFARVRLRLEKRSQVLTVPLPGVVTDKDQSSLWVVGSDSRASRLPVQTGWQQDGMVEIRQGLKGDERVVTVGKEQLSGKGGPVRVLEPPAANQKPR